MLEERCLLNVDTVTNPGDTGAAGQLRTVLNAAAAGDTIVFNLPNPSTITLQTAAGGTLTLTKNVTIQGPGAGQLTISGPNAASFTLFLVQSGVTATISDVTLTKGSGSSAGFNSGGAIYNQGQLTLQSSNVTGNAASYGGGIYNAKSATITVLNSSITGNTSVNAGGGLYNFDFGTMLVQNSTVSGNTAGTSGAGIWCHKYASTTLQNSTVSGNTAMSDGGGIDNDYSSSTLTLQNSTVSGNQAGGKAGGIYNYGTLGIFSSTISANTAAGIGGGIDQAYGNLRLVNSTVAGNQGQSGGGLDLTTRVFILGSTISGNTATTGNGGGLALVSNLRTTVTVQDSTIAGNMATAGNGGGLYAPASTILTLINATVAANGAKKGGGLCINPANVATTLDNALVATNTATISGPDVSGALISATTSLIGNASGATITSGSGNLINVTPLLGPLQNNGGPTATIALLAGSPGIDAGSNVFVTATGIFTDQRGFNRIVNNVVDIGAFEFQPPATTTTLTSSVNPSALGQTVTFTVTVAGSATGSNVVNEGSVTFSDGSTVLAVVPIANGVANFSTATLTAGTHTITATYADSSSGAFGFTASAASLSQVVGSPPPPSGIIAVGADAGGSPVIEVFNANTVTLITAILAFAPTFTGGVRVAVGDVNGDGTPDIIAAAGPGGGPQVTVFDGKTFKPILNFFAFLPTFTGGVYVASGDVNGDGFADIICGAGAGGGPQVSVFSGKAGITLGSFYAFAPTFTGGVRVAAGAVTGGLIDLIAGAGPGGGPQVSVFNGASFAMLFSFFAFPASFTGGVFVTAGDLLGTGTAEIIVGAGAGGLPQVNIYNGTGHLLDSFFAASTDPTDVVTLNASAGADVRVGTTTANGHAAILTAFGPGPASVVNEFDGVTLQLLDSFFAFGGTFHGGLFVGG
jgi:hypothetical protein